MTARLLDILRLRLRSLARRSAVEEELHEEMRYHVEREIEENLAKGMSPKEARLCALRAIGGLEQHKEECRDMRGVHMIDNLTSDIRFAVRQLRKNPGFAATAALMLALGMCASISIFAFVDAALLKPLPYKDPTRLLGVYEKVAPQCPRCNLSWPDYLDWKRSQSTMSALDVYQPRGYTMFSPNGAQSVSAARISDGFFRVLGIAPALGRDFFAGEDSPSAARTAILSYGAWQKLFGGDASIVGRTVVLSDKPTTIVGVLPREFHFAPVGAADFWTPFHPEGDCDLRRSCHGLYGVGRLKDGVSAEAALANVTSIAQQLEKQYPDSNRGQGAAVAPLTEVILGQIRPILLLLMGGAGLLLLISGINVVGLLLVRSEGRNREIAVRIAMGASTGRLVSQFVTEAVVLILAGGGLGVLAGKWLMQLLVRLLPEDLMAKMPFLADLGLTSRVAGFALLIAVLAGVVFSITPGLRVFSPSIHAGLAEGSRGSAGTVWRRLGSKLVVVELAVAVVLLVGAGLLGKSLYRLLGAQLGFRPDHLAMIDVAAPNKTYDKDPQAIALARELLRRTGTLPGVRTAAIVANGAPLSHNGNTMWLRVLGRPWNGEHNDTPTRPISPGYFSALGTRLISGRFFNESEDGSKPQVALINQAFARVHFPKEDPLGKQLLWVSGNAQPPIQIVGVVEDVRQGPLDEEVPPLLYVPFNQSTDTYFTLIVRTSQDEKSTLPMLAATVRDMDPEIITRLGTSMNDKINDSPSAYLHRSTAGLVGGFAGLALVLGLVGLYGVISYSVSQRTREIGVRMALGARPGQLSRLILGEAGGLILVGIVLGLLAAVGAANLVRGLLFRVSPWDVPTLLAVSVMLAAAALLASFVPARRAASVNPAEALRAE